MKRAVQIIGLAGLLAAITGGQALADVVLAGPDSNAGDYSTTALAGAATPSDKVSSGGLTGISLYSYPFELHLANDFIKLRKPKRESL